MASPNPRTKKQHFVPRFYLAQFANSDRLLWTHDCQTDTLRQTTPEKTGYESNIYSPLDENGERMDIIETTLSEIESSAASTIKDLQNFRRLAQEQKEDFAAFLATMFVRSPAQLRQFAALTMQLANHRGRVALEIQNEKKANDGTLTEQDIWVEDFLANVDGYSMQVDRSVGLTAFYHAERLSIAMSKMCWTYEVSEDQQLVTSDNSVFWVNAGPQPVDQLYGFGLGHPQAAIPFPISPNIALRLDWTQRDEWRKHSLSKKKAKLANKYQAQYKERYMFFRQRDDGFCRLSMKYDAPPNQFDAGVPVPDVSVVRKLTPKSEA